MGMTDLRFSLADGNRPTDKTGQPAKLAQPLSINLLWQSQLSLTPGGGINDWTRGPGFLRQNLWYLNFIATIIAPSQLR